MSRSSKTMLRSRFHPAIPVTSSYFYLVHDRARSYRNGGYESSLNTRGNISPSFCRCLGATSRGDCATPRKTHGNRHKLRRKPGIRNPREKGARCAKKKIVGAAFLRFCVLHLRIWCAIATIAGKTKSTVTLEIPFNYQRCDDWVL